MKKIIAYLLAAVMSLGMVCVFPADIGISVSAAASEALAVPTSKYESGSWIFPYGFYTELYCKTKGASVYYSINGGKYKKYTEQIYIGGNVVLKMYSSLNGKKSKVNTYTYELKPKFDVKYSASNKKKTAKIVTECDGAVFYYSTNGKRPTEKSKKYNGKGIDVTNVQKLRILAVKDGWSSSTYSRVFELTSDGKSKLKDYKNKFYYNSLSAKEKKAYGIIYDTLKNGRKKTDSMKDLHIYYEDIDRIFRCVVMENPQFLQVSWNYSDWELAWNSDREIWEIDRLILEYGRELEDIKKTKDSFNETVKRIISGAKKKDTDYERLKYIYDALQKITEYEDIDYHEKKCNTEKYSVFNADSCPVHKKAICSGYSMSFCYLAQLLGYDCICVTGDSDGVHMWNAVKLNGKWYLLDLTWDDVYGEQHGSLNYEYFLTNEKNMTGHTADSNYPYPMISKTNYAA